MPPRVPLTRRRLLGSTLGGGAVLAAGALGGMAGLTGCESGGHAAPRASAAATPVAPDPVALLAAAEDELVALYAATLVRHPDLAGRGLAEVQAEHASHAAALRGLLDATPAATRSASPGSVPTPSPTPAVPTGRSAAVAALAAAERAAVSRFGQACLSAPPARAALLGSIAASESTHLLVLT